MCYWVRDLFWRSNPIQFGKEIEVESPEDKSKHQNPPRLDLRSQACQASEMETTRYTQTFCGVQESLALYVAMPLWLCSQKWTWATMIVYEDVEASRDKMEGTGPPYICPSLTLTTVTTATLLSPKASVGFSSEQA